MSEIWTPGAHREQRYSFDFSLNWGQMRAAMSDPQGVKGEETLRWVPIVAAGVSARLVDGVAVALTEADQTLHTFEGEVSTFIWSQIDGKRSVAQILDGILSSFEVERTRALDDLAQFVQVLQQRGLVSVVEGR